MKTINRVISIIDHGIVLFLRLIKRLVKKFFHSKNEFRKNILKQIDKKRL